MQIHLKIQNIKKKRETEKLEDTADPESILESIRSKVALTERASFWDLGWSKMHAWMLFVSLCR